MPSEYLSFSEVSELVTLTHEARDKDPADNMTLHNRCSTS